MDLPDPDGPTTPIRRPRSSEKDSRRTASRSSHPAVTPSPSSPVPSGVGSAEPGSETVGVSRVSASSRPGPRGCVRTDPRHPPRAAARRPARAAASPAAPASLRSSCRRRPEPRSPTTPSPQATDTAARPRASPRTERRAAAASAHPSRSTAATAAPAACQRSSWRAPPSTSSIRADSARRARTKSASARPADTRVTRAPTPAATRTSPGHDSGDGRDDRGEERRTTADQTGGPPRLAHPELLVEVGVDVVDDRGQHLPAAYPQPSGNQRHERVVHLGPPVGEHPESRVVGDQSLGVPQHGAGEAEGAHRHDGDQQHQDRRMLRRAGDQPGSGRGQRHAGGDREHPEQHPGAPSEPARDRAPSRARSCGSPADPPVGRWGGVRWLATADRVDRCAATARAGSVSTRSAAAATAGRCATTTTVERLRQPAKRAQEHRLGVRVEVGGRLVQEDIGTPSHDDAGQRHARPLTGRQPGAVLAQGRVDAQWQRGDRARRGRLAPAPARSPRRSAAGRPIRTLSATVP